MSVVTHTVDAIEEYLDRRLNVGRETDRTGNGLLVRGSRLVQRIGAALNTSFAVIDAAATQGILHELESFGHGVGLQPRHLRPRAKECRDAV